ncbi:MULTISPECIES: sugar nucleotide-binding protein [Microbulbifer]|uniref:dTDP-4-dehydrorhamnose reductase n=1 Tax=Microbulbifer celer TaxID=435905 RepID=A0ABW3UEH0_9GAMM|nr:MULTISPECIES: sugar nucleotide-binding protein [Microbulbifer]UFN56256.1 NAD(P)-dependent oxidoreductase [Microbulbifer celer]
MPMHHTGYLPDSVAVIGAGNAIDSVLHKGLQRVGFRTQLLTASEIDQLRPGALVLNAACCGGAAHMAEAKEACERLLQQEFHALLHLSSYRVFAGGQRKKLDEEDLPDPDSESGRNWLECERLLLNHAESKGNVSILRLGWQVDRGEKALLGRVIGGLLAGKPVRLDDTSKGSPVTVADMSRVAVAMMQQLASGGPVSGVYHYGAADQCTAMEFGREVVDRVRSLYGEEFEAELLPLEEERADSSAILSCCKVRDSFGIQQRSWRQGLTRQVELWLERMQQASN